ncbi:MAG: DNA recombination protein RmuC [Paracoccaceae bacterium]|nr:DNA recombination protein RmuC [Paracoccaceae bacterium]MDE2915591.1 DNA recombination protein RmuC [Paracoccaceae bacterium]
MTAGGPGLVPALLFGVGIVTLIMIAVGLVLAFRLSRNRAQPELEASLAANLRAVNDALQGLDGRIREISNNQSQTRTELGQTVSNVAKETRESLGELRTRLETIDKAQHNITSLSENVLSLQDILSNKQTRGSFGEIQLHAIVSKALPPDAFDMQCTLSNGKRADCLIRMPRPPGDIVIDSKFPLEAYEALRCAETDEQRKFAARAMRTSVVKHITDISEKYIIDGETADGAILFLPSEAVYAELHANFTDVVRDGFQKRVWIVSPTTCMATLNTLRAILRDVRMREQANKIRGVIGQLTENINRLSDRVDNLDRHFSQAARDIDQIKTSAGKARKHAANLDSFDFDTISSADGTGGTEPDNESSLPKPPNETSVRHSA